MASVDTRAIEGEIDRIRSLGLEDLRREWRRLNHAEPPRISRDLLVLALGYRLQEIAHGGLGKSTRRKLQTMAKALRTTGRVGPAPCLLSRITMNEALGRLRRQRPTVDLEAFEAQLTEAQIIKFPHTGTSDDPERTMAQREILQLVERATDNLPEIFRIVFMTRVIEGMGTEDTANLLGLQPHTVKTRLHRARRLVRDELDKDWPRPDRCVSVRRQTLRAHDQRRSATSQLSRMKSGNLSAQRSSNERQRNRSAPFQRPVSGVRRISC
jgi:DNA-directed RNA polymerase specialized sigma24 family protein